MEFLENVGNWFSSVPGIGTIAAVLAIAVVGWLIAAVVSGVVTKVISKVDKDNRGSDYLFEQSMYGHNRLAKFSGKVAYWGILALVAIAAFNRMGLTAVSSPFETALSGLAFGVPALIKAVVILVVGVVVAKVLKTLVASAWNKVGADRHLDSLLRSEADTHKSPSSRSHIAGHVAFFSVMFLVIPAALNALGIEVLGNAIGGVWTQLFGFLPKLLSAAIIVGVGYVIATLVRAASSRFVASTTADQRTAKWTKTTSLSRIVGSVLFFAIMFPVVIAGVDALGVNAISQPLNEIVGQVLAFVPKFLVAGCIVAVFAFVANFARNWSQSFLSGVGADGWPETLGMNPSEERSWSLSQVLGTVLGAVILLSGISQALETLELGALQSAAATGLAFLPKLIVGGLILVAGVYFGELARKMVAGRKENHLATLAKVTVIAFAGVAAASHVGIADRFALIAFTIIMASVGLGAALAFGLGSRDVANAIVRKNFDVTKMKPVFEEDTLVPSAEFRARGTAVKTDYTKPNNA